MANPAQIPLVNEHLPLLRGALILRGHLWGHLCWGFRRAAMITITTALWHYRSRRRQVQIGMAWEWTKT